MTNKEIAKTFQYLGNIMELHGENPFKIRSYQNSYITLRKLGTPLAEMTEAEIAGIKGVGKNIGAKIKELLETGEMATLQKYRDMTPEGIQAMLQVKGFGPKKIKVIWKDLGVETIGELLYACNENRLVELKGFGQKTQADLKQKLEYFQKSNGKFLLADVEAEAEALIIQLKKELPNASISLCGALRRKNNVVENLEILIGNDDAIDEIFDEERLLKNSANGHVINATTAKETPVIIYHHPKAEFGSKLFRYSAADDFMQAFLRRTEGQDFKNLPTEEAVFAKASLPYLAPELREQEWALELAAAGNVPTLVTEAAMKGVIHAHSTYSDGIHTLREMAEKCIQLGYQYLGISDHSKAAFYANGLKEDRLYQQWSEVDALNKELAPFKIFKGIESDILNDGSLDYEDDILGQFDFIIASVHSNLRMDEEKTTRRILTAIENPHTTILGHPTGRLLLSRLGYPLDHQKIIDACAANRVAIELNANPYRLDLDWTWIPYALEKGVLISIDPDAHSMEGINDIHFGVLAARKGGLSPKQCLSCYEAKEFEKWIKKK